jgi:molecular chaperone GrpE (heat shock protein)
MSLGMESLCWSYESEHLENTFSIRPRKSSRIKKIVRQTNSEGQSQNLETLIHEQNQNLLPPADLVGEIDRLQERLRIERDRNLRTLADFKNYRRRMERDGNKLAEKGKREIILPLLDIVDDIEKSMQWTSDADRPIVKGV